MGIVVDTILTAIIILNIYLGYKKGLIKVAFNIFAFLIAIIISFILFKPTSDYIINNTEFDDKIREVIISNNKQENEQQEEKKQEDSNIIKKYVEENVKNIENELKTKAIERVADTVAIKITKVTTGIGLFIIIRILLILLSFFSEAIADLPVIKQFNEMGGIIYGFVKSIAIIYLVLTIIFIISSFEIGGTLTDAIEKSYITKFLYENNLILKYCLLGKNLL